VTRVRYGILGSIELYDGGGARVPLAGPRQVALLAFLLLHANRAVPTEHLLDSLWHEHVATGGRKRLHVAVSRLRKVIAARDGAGSVQTLTDGYRLVTAVGEVDADVFAAHLASARGLATSGDHAGAVRILDETLPLWRGPPLAEVGYEDFAQAEIRRLEELRLAVIEARADSRLALGDHRALIGELEPVVAAQPTHERLVGQLMLALYRSGRQAEALDTYQRTFRHLVATLGLEPGPALKRLQLDVLEQADALGERRGAAVAARAAVEPLPPPGRAPLPPLLEAMARRVFVGRADERARLQRGWAAAAAGQRSVAVVTGEPGIGKTAIAAQLAGDVRAAGGSVLYGACDAHSVVPYHPVVMALREHVRHVRPPWRSGDWLEDVATVLGLTPGSPGSAPRTSARDGDEERFWLFEGVRRILELLADRQPVLLVADDLHWAPPSTLMMLGHLARDSDPARLMFVAIYRNTDVATDGPVREIWSSSRTKPMDEIALSGLREEETAELIEAHLGSPVTSDVGRPWHERTGGHPFFLQQLLQRADTDTIEDVAAAELPEGVRDLVSRRVGRLSERARGTLAVGAVIGREFDVGLVSTLVDEPVDACLAALEEAIASGLLVEPDHVDRFAFTHAIVRETLYQQQSRSRRVRLHARVASALERSGAPAAELAHHFFAARHVSGHEKAVEQSRRAALAAAAALADEDAAAHFRRALEALEEAPSFSEHERCQLLLGLGTAEARAGQPTVDATFADAVNSARRRGDARQLALAALAGRQSEPGLRDETRVALLAEAHDALGDEPSALRVEVLARHASALHFADRDAQARATSAEALELARELGDPHAQLAALHGRHGALLQIADVEERLDVLGRLIDLAERTGEPDFVALGREWSVYARLELGELTQARVEHEGFAAVAAVLRQPRFDHALLAWRSVFAQLDGRLDDAERLALDGYRYAGRVQIADAAALLASQMCFIRRDQGRLSELLPSIGSYASTAGDFSWRAGLVVALAGAGEHARARSALAAAGRHAFEDVPRDFWWLATIALFAEGCAVVGDDRHAAALYCLLEPYAERHAQLVFAAHLGCIHRFLGLLAAVSGDPPRAIAHLERAWERHEATGAPALAHRSACDLARILMRTGRDGDRRRAEELLHRATDASKATPLAPLVAGLAREAKRSRHAPFAPR